VIGIAQASTTWPPISKLPSTAGSTTVTARLSSRVWTRSDGGYRARRLSPSETPAESHVAMSRKPPSMSRSGRRKERSSPVRSASARGALCGVTSRQWHLSTWIDATHGPIVYAESDRQSPASWLESSALSTSAHLSFQGHRVTSRRSSSRLCVESAGGAVCHEKLQDGFMRCCGCNAVHRGQT
jgi:hypothetical protein